MVSDREDRGPVVVGVGHEWEAVVMAIVRVPLLFFARLVVEVLRDVTGALGGLLHAFGRVTHRLVGAAVLAVIAYAAFLRVVVHVWLPPVVWLALAGAALAAMLAWLLGWCLTCLADPGLLVRRLADPGCEGGVSEERIAEWEAAWQRALLYQQRQQAAGDEQKASNGRRGPAWRWRRAAGSPYEILGVEPGATPEQIRTAYRALALRMHPDRNPGFVPEATERFREIQAAYELLSDPGSRPQHPRAR
jgi:DnaJ domain